MSKLWESNNGVVTCHLCFRNCVISEGAQGFCQVNQNVEGTLHFQKEACTIAMQVDPIEKKPLYHFFPGSEILSLGTNGCNFRCPFCQNSGLSFARPAAYTKTVTANEIVEMMCKRGLTMIAFTYNEPTVSWLWFRDIAKKVKEAGFKTVMVTNGAMGEAVCEEVVQYIDALNIDLKCGRSEHYSKTLKGSREFVLRNIESFYKAGLWIELTTLLVPGLSDSVDDLELSVRDIEQRIGYDIPWHLSAYHPAHDYEEPATSDTLLLRRVDYLKECGFKNVYPGNIAANKNTYCHQCGALLIERSSFKTGCYIEAGNCSECGHHIQGRFK